ncbi:hypothetical protein EYF80_067816 [Liparis tanakae]|uniref:Uncharacterized protein n=1 Tax=Liparis tanakae TaxID=230148 RepID=A0A4Z2E109_9TELE|nr:hypothetical protein EYF80_067816 [Liparis tanakae]
MAFSRIPAAYAKSSTESTRTEARLESTPSSSRALVTISCTRRASPVSAGSTSGMRCATRPSPR